MSTIDQTNVDAFTVCWARGDNDAKAFTITSGGSAVDISSWTLQMTVNTLRDPIDSSTEIFTAVGVFVTDGTDGKVSFRPAAGETDDVEIGAAFYDIARLTPDVKTLIKGRVSFIQDIGK